MPFKIAFVTNFCPHYVIKLFEGLSHAHNVSFYFTGGHESYWERKNQVKIGNFKGEFLPGFFLSPKTKITPGLIRLFFQRNEIFIKTIDDRFALLFIFLIAKILRKPFILWTQLWVHPQTFFHKMTFVMTRFIYHHADAIIVYGYHVEDYLKKNGVEDKKIFCALQSTDNALYNKKVSAHEKKNLRESLSIFDKERIILCVSRLEECKGLEHLIDAVSYLQNLEAKLIFIGTGSQKDFFVEKSKKLQIKCLFLDHIPNEQLYKYYAIADVFVLPSITTEDFKEPWGIVVNEAMNQSCPVIATDAVGAAMGGLVDHQKNGIVVPEKNSEALREALYAILKDDGLRQRMGESAYQKVSTFTHDAMLTVFQEAINFAKKQTDNH